MTLYDQQWPVNFAEQKTLAKRILDRTKDVAIRAQSVFLRQRTQPSRSEWETAYVSQTGGLLPIPVGVKLIWFNLSLGECETFIVTNDQFAGLSASGNVYQQISTVWDKPSIKLIGYQDSKKFPHRQGSGGFGGSATLVPLRMIEAENSRSYIAVSLNSNETYDWSSQGLESLILFYKLRSTMATPSGVIIFFSSDDETAEYRWFDPPAAATRLGQSNYMATLGANAFTSTDNGLGVTIATGTGSGSLASACATGTIIINNFTQRNHIDSGTGLIIPTDDIQAPAGVHIGGHVGTGLTTNQIFLFQGSIMRNDEYHQRANFPTVNSQDNPTDSISKVWAYGIFKGLT